MIQRLAARQPSHSSMAASRSRPNSGTPSSGHRHWMNVQWIRTAVLITRRCRCMRGSSMRRTCTQASSNRTSRESPRAMLSEARFRNTLCRWVHQFSFKTPSERGCELTYVNTVGRRPNNAQHAELVGNGRVPTAEETVRMAMGSATDGAART